MNPVRDASPTCSANTVLKRYFAKFRKLPIVAQSPCILANNLYVAMTRARSILTLFSQRKKNADAEFFYEVIEDCLGNLEEKPAIECDNTIQDDVIEILDRIGHKNRKWLVGIWSTHRVSQEPLTTTSGQIVAEPLFHFRLDEKHYACFGNLPPRERIRRRLEDVGVEVLHVGETLDVQGGNE